MAWPRGFAGRRLWPTSDRRQQLSLRSDPHAISGALTGRGGAQSAHRVRGAGLTGLGSVHGGWCVCGLQFQPSHPRPATRREFHAGRARRDCARHRVRPAEPAAARVLSRGLDVGRAILRQWALTKFSWFSNNNPSGVIDAPPLRILGLSFDSSIGRYLFALTIVAVLTSLAARLVNTQTGHNFIAVRDNELAAKVIGVPVLRTKLLAFAISSFIVSVAGVLWAFAYLRTVEPAGFNLDRSFQIVFIIIIGGLASIRGAFYGAALLVVFPLILSRTGSLLLGDHFDSGVLEMSRHIVLGALIILFLIAEPDGLVALSDRLKRRLLPIPKDL